MKATERCDRCGAQAYVMTLHSGNALYWCNHHYQKYEYLIGDSVHVDDREMLTASV